MNTLWHYCDLKNTESGQTAVNNTSPLEFSAIKFPIFFSLIILFSLSFILLE